MPNFSNGPGGVTFSAVAAFPAKPQVAFSFQPDAIIVENIGTDSISFSFDGTNVHGTVDPGTSQLRMTKRKNIWFRDEGGGGTAIARVSADTLS